MSLPFLFYYTITIISICGIVAAILWKKAEKARKERMTYLNSVEFKLKSVSFLLTILEKQACQLRATDLKLYYELKNSIQILKEQVGYGKEK